jgi:MscS family membrane protein
LKATTAMNTLAALFRRSGPFVATLLLVATSALALVPPTYAQAAATASKSGTPPQATSPPSTAAQPAAARSETTQPASAQAAPATAPKAPDGPPLNKDSPRAALWHFFDATRDGRWEEAARYLSLTDKLKPRGPELARRLKAVIDDTHWIDLEIISEQPLGRVDDGLPPELEEVSRINLAGRSEALWMIRTADADGPFWTFSAGTVARIDAWYARLPDRWLRDAFVYAGLDVLLLPGPFELLWWQWLAVPVLLLLAWALGSLLGRLTRRALRRILARAPGGTSNERLLAALGAPLTLAWGLNVFWLAAQTLVLTDPAYRTVDSVATAGMVFAVFWALWRSSSLITERMLQRPWAMQSASARTLVTVGSNFARGALLAVGALAMLAAFGYPIGTLLAGLGIGGLAIAFGAQKTIENVFGSVSLAVDQPFRVGDFVRIDDFVGTVEDIGLRSTRIRTLDRTLISIPNGKLAEQRLESFDARDRMRLAATLGVVYSTTREQMGKVLEGFERVLRNHPQIWPDAVTVRFKELASSSLDIEVMAWFAVPTWAEFQRCRQEVLLGFMQIVEDAGTSFAFPTQTVHLLREAAAAT